MVQHPDCEPVCNYSNCDFFGGGLYPVVVIEGGIFRLYFLFKSYMPDTSSSPVKQNDAGDSALIIYGLDFMAYKVFHRKQSRKIRADLQKYEVID